MDSHAVPNHLFQLGWFVAPFNLRSASVSTTESEGITTGDVFTDVVAAKSLPGIASQDAT